MLSKEIRGTVGERENVQFTVSIQKERKKNLQIKEAGGPLDDGVEAVIKSL